MSKASAVWSSGVIISLHETPERWCGFTNVTRTSIDMVENGSNFNFWVNCPFKVFIRSTDRGGSGGGGGDQTTGLTGSCFPLQTDRRTVLWTPTCRWKQSPIEPTSTLSTVSQAHLSQSPPPWLDSIKATKAWQHGSRNPENTHVNTQSITQTNAAVVEISFGFMLVVFHLFPKEKFLGGRKVFTS